MLISLIVSLPLSRGAKCTLHKAEIIPRAALLKPDPDNAGVGILTLQCHNFN
jgi:hypothetical protein